MGTRRRSYRSLSRSGRIPSTGGFRGPRFVKHPWDESAGEAAGLNADRHSGNRRRNFCSPRRRTVRQYQGTAARNVLAKTIGAVINTLDVGGRAFGQPVGTETVADSGRMLSDNRVELFGPTHRGQCNRRSQIYSLISGGSSSDSWHEFFRVRVAHDYVDRLSGPSCRRGELVGVQCPGSPAGYSGLSRSPGSNSVEYAPVIAPRRSCGLRSAPCQTHAAPRVRR